MSRQGLRDAAEVRDDDNVVPLVETRDGGRRGRRGRRSLRVDRRRGISLAPSTRAVVTADFDRLDMNLGGSGSVQAGKRAAKDVRIHLAGSGSSRAQANAASALAITIAGRGEAVHASSARPRIAVIGIGIGIGIGTVRRGA